MLELLQSQPKSAASSKDRNIYPVEAQIQQGGKNN